MRPLTTGLLWFFMIFAGLGLFVIVAGDSLLDRPRVRDLLRAQVEDATSSHWRIGGGPRVHWLPQPQIHLWQVVMLARERPPLHAEEVVITYRWNSLFTGQPRPARIQAWHLSGAFTKSSDATSQVNPVPLTFDLAKVDLQLGSARLPLATAEGLELPDMRLGLGPITWSRKDQSWHWPAAELTADLSTQENARSLSLGNLQLLIQGLRFGGDIHANLTEEALMASGHLAVDALDLHAWLESLERAPTSAGQRLISKEGMGSFAAGIDFQLDTQAFADQPFSTNIFFSLPKFYGGRVDGQLKVRPGDRGAPRFQLSAQGESLQIGPILSDLQAKLSASGVAKIALELSASGGNWEGISESLAGEAAVLLRDVQPQGLSFTDMLAATGPGLKAAGLELPRLHAFREISASFHGDLGRFRSQDVIARLPGVLVTGTGLVELPAENVDFDLTAIVQDNPNGETIAELNGLPMPVRIQGAWQTPRVRIDPRPALREAAARALKRKADQHQDKLRALEERTGIKGLEQGLRKLLGTN
ncbi:putative assembly protein [Thiorhodovibrio winogradskyi]|uniref:Assembly protein n=2 Tax=Thiorhodovibrio winogradskyi TaxID=77007 RepID=A0ABZ0S476_9GAMM